jgi:hypothetical protein
MYNGIPKHILKIRFSFFSVVSPDFGFKVSKKCQYKQKKDFFLKNLMWVDHKI